MKRLFFNTPGVNRKWLLRQLAVCRKVVRQSYYPITPYIKVAQRKDKLLLEATSGDVFYSVIGDSGNEQVKRKVGVLVSPDRLYQIVSKIRKDYAGVEFTAEGKCRIDSVIELCSEDSLESFPTFPTEEGTEVIGEGVLNLRELVAMRMRKLGEGYGQVWEGGAFFNLPRGEVVQTDGRRLYVIRVRGLEGEESFLLPSGALEVLSMVGVKSQDVRSVRLGKRWVTFILSEAVLGVRKHECDYPDYVAIVDGFKERLDEKGSILTIRRKGDFEGVLQEALSVFGTGYAPSGIFHLQKSVRLEAGGLYSKEFDFDHFYVGNVGNTTEVRLNLLYLHDAIKCFPESGRLNVAFIGPLDVCRVTCEQKPGYQAYIMPMRED